MAGFDVTFAVVLVAAFLGWLCCFCRFQGALLFALLFAELFACLGDKVFAHGVITMLKVCHQLQPGLADFGYRGAQA